MNESKLIIIGSLIFIIILLSTIVNYKILKRFNKKGYLAFIPIISWWHLFSICNIPPWLSILPVANIVGLIFVHIIIPSKLGKNIFYSLGYLFFPFIVGFMMLKEKEVLVNYKGPDLLATDPFQEGKIDLMAIDPNSFLENNYQVQKEIKNKNEVNIINQLDNNIEKNIIKKSPEKIIVDAFDVPMPEPGNKNINK